MSNPNQSGDVTPPTGQTGTDPAAQSAGAPEQVADGAPKQVHHDDLIAALRREISDLRERSLRAHADVENIRKRSEREKDDVAKYAVTKFARDVLSISDNLQRAISSVAAGATDQNSALKSLLDGVTLTDRELLNVLDRHGVKRIEAQDAPFNPHLHQAVMEMDNPAVPSGTVTKVFQSGFTIEDRVLRPAMVVVARGGPAAGSAPEASNDATASAAATETPGSSAA